MAKQWHRVEFFGGTHTAVKASDEVEAYCEAPKLANEHVVVAKVYGPNGKILMDRTRR